MFGKKTNPIKCTATHGRMLALAAILGGTAIIGVCLYYHLERRRLVHETVVAIGRLGGHCDVTGRSDLSIVSVDVGGLSEFGDDQLALLAGHDPRVLDLGGTAITNEGLKQLSSMRNLMVLNIEGTQITDEGLEHIRDVIGASQLRHLDLGQTGVTDIGLKEQFSRLGNLTSLDLEGTQITDVGVEHLASIVRQSRLRHLNLSGTQITDNGVQCLDAPKLCGLWFDRTKVGDRGLRELLRKRNVNSLSLAGSRVTDDACKWLDRVHCLNLAGTSVTDRGVKELLSRSPHAPHVVWLDLSGTRVTDDAWDDLGRLPRVIMISVRGTDVTAQGAAAFRDAKPDCAVLLDESGRSPAGLSTRREQICDLLMKNGLIGRKAQNLRDLLDSADNVEDWIADSTSYYEFYLGKGDYEGEPTITVEVDIPTETVYGAFAAAPIW